MIHRVHHLREERLFNSYLAERTVSAETQQAFHRAFDSELELLRTVREIRHD